MIIIFSEPSFKTTDAEDNNIATHTTFILDISLSMYIGSPSYRRIDEVVDFLQEYLVQNTNKTFSLIVFTDIPSLVIPETDDIQFLSQGLAQLRMRPPVLGTTNISQAMERIQRDASFYLHSSVEQKSMHEILFVSDGEFHDAPSKSILDFFDDYTGYAFVPASHARGQRAYIYTDQNTVSEKLIPELSETNMSLVKNMIENIGGQIIKNPKEIQANQGQFFVRYSSLTTLFSVILLVYLLVYLLLYKP